MGLYRISLSMKFRFKRGSSLSRMLPWMNSSQTSVAQFSSLPPPPVHAFKYCRDLVYKKDYEGYLASLCLPSSLQPISWGLRSFNIELATIRDVVHQDALGSMRFQFWRDQVMTLSKNQTMHHHPVMELLSYHLREVTISIPRLKKMISAREENFHVQQYMKVSELETYAEQTTSQLLYLHLEAMNIKSLDVDHLASHVGKAITLVKLLKSTPSLLQQRRMYLPSDLCAKHGLVTERLFREPGPSPELTHVVYDLASLAHQHLQLARACARSLTNTTSNVFLPMLAASRWLDVLEKVEFQLFHTRLHQPDPWLPLHMWWASKKKKNVF